jgi:DNA-binding NarL/FixJ family response regulator
MMTGYMTDRTHLLEAYSTGVIDFLKKPFDVIELKARADSIYQLAKFYKEELKSRDRELIANAIRLAEINAFLNDILSKIDDTRINISPAEFKSIINSKIADTIWDEFSNNFIKIHPNFVSNITAKHGSLTPAEIKLASLLRLNLSTKEVASLLHQNPDSIKVARARLRKKLHLDTEENLSVYLLNF